MNKELKTRSTDREAIERIEEEEVEGREELEMRFSQRTLEIAGTDPLRVPGFISRLQGLASSFYPSDLGSAETKRSRIEFAWRFLFFRWSNYFTIVRHDEN